MAERGAYLTGTAYIRPTIFEILAQKSLASILEPAFQKFLSFVVSFNPERYGHILEWKDEGYFLFNALLQRYYLKKYSASFSETFYSLKRIAVHNTKPNEKMSRKQEVLSLILLVVIPYLKTKLERLSSRYQFEEASNCAPQERLQKFFRKCLIRGHSILFTLYKTLTVYNYILYASEKSVYPSPLLRLLGVTLTYAELQPTRNIIDLLKNMTCTSFSIHDGWDIFQESITRLIELAAFFLQFLSWWNQENYITDIMSLPAPPAPKMPSEALRYKGICPLCHMQQRIHTVLMVSGFVFCYQCILLEIRKNRKCPITFYPATEDDLIRLYID